jgi:hypothetical protein
LMDAARPDFLRFVEYVGNSTMKLSQQPADERVLDTAVNMTR